jgi:hypothetical protein
VNTIDAFIVPIISFIGLILNLINLIITSNKQFKEKFYKYQKVESIFICLNLVLQCFRPVAFYKQNWFSKSLISIIYKYHVLYHSVGIFELSSILVQILSSLYYYKLIFDIKTKNRINFLDKISYKIISIFIFFSSFLLYLYIYFDCVIRKAELHIMNEYNNVTLYIRFVYRCEPNKEYQNFILKRIYEICIFVFRDGISLIIITILNFMIYSKVSNNIKFKKTFQNKVLSIQTDVSTTNETINKNFHVKISKVEMRLAIMIFFCNFNLIIGRFPILIVFISKNIVDFSDGWYNFNTFANLCVYVSYLNRFFLFYACNEKFKSIFWQCLNHSISFS